METSQPKSCPPVLHRKYSKLPIVIPHVLAPGLDDSNDQFIGTTPLGMELIRRKIFGLKKKLAGAGVVLRTSGGE
jgi:hypothetical protein